MLKPEIKYGFWAAVLLIAWVLAQYALGFHTVYFQYTVYGVIGRFVILFVALFLSLKEKRGDLSGHITVRQGVRSGLFQLAITAVIASGFMFIYDYRINPLWVENLVEWERANGGSGLFMRLANDPATSAIVLSNTETHLCTYFLSILLVGGMMAFLISFFLGISTPRATRLNEANR